MSSRLARSAAAALVTGALLALLPGSASADRSLGGTLNGKIDLTADSKGSPHVVFQRDGDTVRYCRIAVLKDKCKRGYRHDFRPPEERTRPGIEGVPQVITHGSTVRVLVGSGWDSSYEWISTNRGRSFRRARFGTVPPVDVAQTLGGVVAVGESDGLGASSEGLLTQWAPFWMADVGKYVTAAARHRKGPNYHDAQVSTSKADGVRRTLVTWGDSRGNLRRKSFLNDHPYLEINNAAHWGEPGLISKRYRQNSTVEPSHRLVTGKGGTFVLYQLTAGKKRWMVRKFSGPGFGKAYRVSEAKPGSLADLFQTRSGKVYAAWSKTHILRYRRIKPWAKRRTLFKVKKSLASPTEVEFVVVKKGRLVVYQGSGGGPDGGVRAHWVK